MVKSEGFKGFFKKTSNRDACTRLMELTPTFLPQKSSQAESESLGFKITTKCILPLQPVTESQ